MALFFSIVAGRGRLMLLQIAKSLDDYVPTPPSGIAKKALAAPHSGQLVDILSCNAQLKLSSTVC
jgi:hypothetical protein